MDLESELERVTEEKNNLETVTDEKIAEANRENARQIQLTTELNEEEMAQLKSRHEKELQSL